MFNISQNWLADQHIFASFPPNCNTLLTFLYLICVIMSSHVNIYDFVKIMWWIWYVLTKSKLEHDPVNLLPYILPLGNKLKRHKKSIFWNPCMYVLTEMTETLNKACNGTEKLTFASNFKNNVINIWINKTKTKWFNLLVVHVVESWTIAYNITT